MKPLTVLLSVFFLSAGILFFVFRRPDWALAARIAMSAMLLFTAIAHFAFVKGMMMMLPAFIPFKKAIVYLTGCFEIAAAIGLLIPGLMQTTACLLIVFFLLILPANIYAAIQKVNYQTGDRNGSGAAYLWFRVPLQLLFISWVYLSCFVYTSI